MDSFDDVLDKHTHTIMLNSYLYAILMIHGVSIANFSPFHNVNLMKDLIVKEKLLTLSKYNILNKQIKEMAKYGAKMSQMTLLNNIEKITNTTPDGWDIIKLELEKYTIDERQLNSIVQMNATQLLQTASYLEMLKYKASYPVVKYIAILDKRTTAFCRAYNGKIFLIDNEITEFITPSNHFNCRSYLEPLAIGEYDEKDIQKTFLNDTKGLILPAVGFDFKLDNIEALVDNYKFLYDNELNKF